MMRAAFCAFFGLLLCLLAFPVAGNAETSQTLFIVRCDGTNGGNPWPEAQD